MKPLRIAILGSGAMGRMHAAAYAQMPDVELVDPVPSRNLDRVRALLARQDIDAIDVCVPSRVHSWYVICALDSGKHVFCETPMALDLEEGQAMRDAARKAGRLLQVGLLCRSIAAYRHIKELAESGVHGRLVSLTAWRLGSYLRPDAPDHKPHYGDETIELMSFDLDFARWLMGRPTRISAAGVGDVTAVLDYGDGRHASIAASGLMPPGHQHPQRRRLRGFSRLRFSSARRALHAGAGARPPGCRSGPTTRPRCRCRTSPPPAPSDRAGCSERGRCAARSPPGQEMAPAGLGQASGEALRPSCGPASAC
jgi:predicted dehydrogenase